MTKKRITYISIAVAIGLLVCTKAFRSGFTDGWNTVTGADKPAVK